MPGTPYPLGPFTAGMNNISEEATVDDNQVTLAMNLELDFDGSYKSRPAIIEDADTPVAGQAVHALGWYVRSDNVTFLICTTSSKTWLYNIDTKSFTEIWASRASGATQYDNHVVLCSASGAGIRWEGGVSTAIPTMPAGTDIVLYQERFWIFGVKGTANQNRVWFSNITSAGSSPTSIWDWTTATDFFEVKKGDGEWITALVADTNALLIFRNRSFFRFTYPASPFQGTLYEQNATIGADNRWSIVPYEGYYLVFSQGVFYQLINYAFYPLSNKRINFIAGTPASPVAAGYEVLVSLFGARCIVWYYGATYVYDIITNTWCMWESPSTYAARFLEIPQTSLVGTVRTALAVNGTGSTSRHKVYRIVNDDLPAGGASEAMTCTLRTKSYAFDESAQYKRMFFWTAEVRSAIGMSGSAFPSAIPTDGITYDDMDLVTYDELDMGSWDNPLVSLPEFETDVTFPSSTPIRALVKCIQDSRLLRMYYEIHLDCDGTERTSPVRVYSITPYVRIKAAVSKQVS